MKNQILFIHSAGDQGPHEGSGYLKANLENSLGNDYEIVAPLMPDPENPKYEGWKRQIAKSLDALTNDFILFGHSLGGSVLVKYLSEEAYRQRISGLFVASAPFWEKETGWEVADFILQKDFASKLSHVRRIFLYHSKDDEEVPFDHLAYYAERLPQATVRVLNGQGHYFKDNASEFVNDIRSLKEL